MTELKQFAERFNKSDKAKPSTQVDIDKLEHEFKIILPNDYKTFLLNFGNIWTPDILDLVVDKELDISEVQQFWSIDEIIYDKQNEWTSHVSTDIIPFASDSMGNIFAFLRHDIKSLTETTDIYFFDHDFNTVEKISNSFTDWIDEFNKI
jgi:cell wall assembly regulator SMI1